MAERFVPRGSALETSNEELESASEIRAEDIPLALAWLRLFSPALARMVEALPFDRTDLTLIVIAGLLNAGNRYVYLTQAGLFYDLRRRQVIQDAEVRRLLDVALDRGSMAARQQTLALRSRSIDLAAWELSMRAQVKASTIAARLAVSGTRRTHLDALASMQSTVLGQFNYLKAFAKQIQTGEQPLDGRSLQRTEAYIQTARAAHMEGRREVAVSLGYDEERSILNPADHCKQCVAEAKKGWQPIGKMIQIGARLCLWQCKCTAGYRNSVTGEVHGASRVFDLAA